MSFSQNTTVLLGTVILRRALAWLISRVSVRYSYAEVDSRLSRCAPLDQMLLIGGTVLALSLATAVFAHAGTGGVAAFWAAILYVIR